MSKKSNIKKAIWYSVENMTMILFGLFSVIIVARVFGPDNLGKLSLVQAVSATTMFVVVLGLDHIIVRDLAKDPKNSERVTTILTIQLIGWVLYSILTYFILFFFLDIELGKEMLLIIASVLITTYFSRATVFRLYFQAINTPKVIAFSAITSRSIALTFLFSTLLLDADYYIVVFFIPIQAVIQSSILAVLFFKENKQIEFKFNIKLAKETLKEAIPLIASSALFPIFMQADILLISSFLSEKDVGLYSAAARVVTQFVFIGHIIMMTFYLPLSNKPEESKEQELFISGLIKILFTLGFLSSLLISTFSQQVISVLYGSEFEKSADVLSIIAWNWVLIFPAALYSRLLVLKGLGRYEFIKSLTVASISLSLNYIIIPVYGIKGAAYVSLFSYFIADFMIYSIFKDTRWLFYNSVSSKIGLLLSPKKSINSILFVVNSK